ncbi:MAG TPA: carbonic anhydrase [Candidatus Binatia bacterium]|jgi:carbonic anhydrase|nr:carbonic anhydrase [Candidatus Binatia bacterium]
MMLCLSPFSRRRFMRLFGTAATGLTLAGFKPASAASPPPATGERGTTYDPDEVLRELLEGNQHFIRGELTHPGRRPEDFQPLAKGQRPRAVIVGCADSRVTPEILFDQGIGDLFVVRVAGNVISGAGAIVEGSIEYAVAELGVPLVVVLGHGQCGAVKAVIKHIDEHDPLPGALDDLVNMIKPAVTRAKGQSGDLLENAVKANVQIGVERLQTLEPVLADFIKQRKVKVVGATYDLHSGRVTVIV